ncbi:molybdenum cofactor biosysynthesis protein [Virgisporangium aliadipatigenens]|uniref:Molybdenum cofactor biosysynthesis protein n=1 Tax=Virgisporangium aliadipatigenens TaxID=741659 RepID=A0A8J3YK40_9ACTN|nr:MOSC N-terminal beta barrel domain-containing protein [Virgisporangium aliadipatigenens]GIJ45308.1 molybdenum cofactor biosysynthesis protein [Virgisporangium aliadipatigenens]
MGEIVWLCRYPVKSLRGEELSSAVLDGDGLAGDRRRALVDTATGLVASAKDPRKWRSLMGMSARCEGDGIAVTMPDGTVVRDGDPDVDDHLSRAAGRPVRLTSERPAGAALERLTPEGEPGAGTLTRGALRAAGSFVDFGAVHLVTTATLDALGADRRRFRPNVVLRMRDDTPFAENAWPGRVLATGTAAIRVVAPTPRCAVPTLAQGDDLPADPRVLRAAAAANRIPVFDLGTLTCVGAYGAVARPGTLRVGDRVVMRDEG